MKYRSLAALSALALGLSLSLSASAATITFTNPDFETGNLNGWTTLGSVTATASTTVTTYNSVVWTVNAAGTTMAQLRSQGASVASIEQALGLASGTLQPFNTNANGGNLTNGSAMWQDFSGAAGDTLAFAWNYVATDYIPFNDPAYALLIGPSNSIEVLASIHGQGAAVGTAGNSGWQTFAATLGSTGNYRLAFVTTNDKDQILDSYLHIDATAGTCNPNCPPVNVPEPGTLAVSGLGLMALAFTRRRKQAV